MFTKGQKVRIRKEWQDDGDDSVDFYVVEDRGERVLIVADLGLSYNPVQSVEKSMLEPERVAQ